MKQFILKSLLNLILFSALLPVWGRIVSLIPNKIIGHEVYKSLNKSKKKHPSKILVLGDSVGRQLYSNDTYNDSIYALTCNRAITLAGHYILLHNYLEKNIPPQEVVLLLTPSGLNTDIDGYSFQYFLKPFYKREYFPLMNDYLQDRIQTIPHYRSVQLPWIKYSSITYCPTEDFESEEGLFSRISADYLDSITTLCKSLQIPFHLYATPVPLSYRQTYLEREQRTCNIPQHLLNEYTSSLKFFQDTCFVDGVHLKKAFIPSDYFHFCQ